MSKRDNATAEKVKGKAKQAIGKMTDDENLQAEGFAQEERGEAIRQVAVNEAKAEQARREAWLREQDEKAHQSQ